MPNAPYRDPDRPLEVRLDDLLGRVTLDEKLAIREAGLASIMNAYHELDGVPCGCSGALLIDLLRGELGFDGVVVADYFTVDTLHGYHHVAADKADAARRALEAGLDVELPALDCFGAPLRAAVEGGDVPMALVDRAARRLLRLEFARGLFEQPLVDGRRSVSRRRRPRPGWSRCRSPRC